MILQGEKIRANTENESQSLFLSVETLKKILYMRRGLAEVFKDTPLVNIFKLKIPSVFLLENCHTLKLWAFLKQMDQMESGSFAWAVDYHTDFLKVTKQTVLTQEDDPSLLFFKEMKHR